ncbi:MAG: hypothetical protein ACREXY_07965, partial [Gammaproteobacteria bacterium]
AAVTMPRFWAATARSSSPRPGEAEEVDMPATMAAGGRRWLACARSVDDAGLWTKPVWTLALERTRFRGHRD